MKRTENTPYKLLIHCCYPQIRTGFEETIRLLPFNCKTMYANLSENGIMHKLRFHPDLIIILLSESDADFNLALKIKLFEPHIPLLFILPKIPDSYRCYLSELGVESILELPAKKEKINESITHLLRSD